MGLFVFTGVVALEVLMYAEYKRRIKIFSYMDALFFYVAGCQIVYFQAPEMDAVALRAAGSYLSFYYDHWRGIVIYMVLLMVVYVSTLGIRIVSNRSMANAVPLTAGLSVGLAPLSIMMLAFSIAHIFVVDWDTLWYNTKYLLLSSPSSLAMSSVFGDFIIRLAQPVSVLCSFLLFLAIERRSRVTIALLLIPFAWYWLYWMANGSRAAALMSAIPLFFALNSRIRGRWLVAILFFVLTFLSLQYALGTRSIREFGLSSIGDKLVYFMSSSENTFQTVLLNLTQGIFITSDGFEVPGSHPELYVWLSFSPFPSFIDNFDTVRATSELRLHAYVPMAAITEAVRFGAGPLMAVAAVTILAGRLSLLVARRGFTALALLSAVYLVFVVVQAGAYPLRNILRQEYAMILLLLGVQVWGGLVPNRAGASTGLLRKFPEGGAESSPLIPAGRLRGQSSAASAPAGRSTSFG